MATRITTHATAARSGSSTSPRVRRPVLPCHRRCRRRHHGHRRRRRARRHSRRRRHRRRRLGTASQCSCTMLLAMAGLARSSPRVRLAPSLAPSRRQRQSTCRSWSCRRRMARRVARSSACSRAATRCAPAAARTPTRSRGSCSTAPAARPPAAQRPSRTCRSVSAVATVWLAETLAATCWSRPPRRRLVRRHRRRLRRRHRRRIPRRASQLRWALSPRRLCPSLRRPQPHRLYHCCRHRRRLHRLSFHPRGPPRADHRRRRLLRCCRHARRIPARPCRTSRRSTRRRRCHHRHRHRTPRRHVRLLHRQHPGHRYHPPRHPRPRRATLIAIRASPLDSPT